MKTIDKVCELWGRTLSPIETQKIINLMKEFSEEIILEAAMISSDKIHPMQYMAKVLYYVNHPLEPKKEEKPVEEVPVETGSKWLDKFQEKIS